jgi:SAM-dependent methyltransferase
MKGTIMLKTFIQVLDNRIAFPYRYAKLTASLLPMLDGVTDALDVGPGDGRLSRYLMDATGIRIEGIDVARQPNQFIDIHQYDGYNFPFADNSFDCVLMVDMLHHTHNIERVMSESHRVARRFVLVKDHY